VVVDSLEAILNVVADQAGEATLVGLVTLLIGASGVFGQLHRSFNTIWTGRSTAASGGFLGSIKLALGQRAVAFGMVLSTGLLLVMSLLLGTVSTVVTQALGLLDRAPDVVLLIAIATWRLALTLALDTLVYATLFKYLADTRVAWRDVWVAALICAGLWELSKQALALFLAWSSFSSAYGAISAILVTMVWIYVSGQILFLGAEFTKVYASHLGSRAANAAPPQSG